MANITLLGAGSTAFSIDLLRDISLIETLSGSTLTLVDIDHERLETAKKFVEKYSKEAKTQLNIKAFTDRRKGLEEADFVICAVKVGGYGPLEEERIIAEESGYYRGIGDRVSCYYGGVGAYHQIKFLEDLCTDMQEICPEAWLIQTANPVFEGTNYITRYTNTKAVGVCHGHFGYKIIAEVLGLDLDKVSAQVVGVNHCTFLTHFLYEGKDAYPLIDEWVETKAEEFWGSESYFDPKCDFSEGQMSPGAIDTYRLYGLMPIGDAVRSVTPWWHHIDYQTKEKWYGKGGGFDSEVGWKSYLHDKTVKQEKINRLLDSGAKLMDEFPLVASGEQHIPFANAISNDQETSLVLNIPNNGLIDGVADDVLVEVPAVVSGRGIQGLNIGALPEKLMNNVLIPRISRMNNIHYAYANRDRETLVLMLMDDPRTKSYEQAKALIDKLLSMPWNSEAAKHYIEKS